MTSGESLSGSVLVPEQQTKRERGKRGRTGGKGGRKVRFRSEVELVSLKFGVCVEEGDEEVVGILS